MRGDSRLQKDGNLQRIVNTNILALNTENLQFIHVGNEGAAISYEEVLFDSFWIASVRLSRSVALDTQKTSLAEALFSYEPCLNPGSSFHKRVSTHIEADAFVAQRNMDSSLTLVYQSEHISLDPNGIFSAEITDQKM